jgi:hypothetical protein
MTTFIYDLTDTWNDASTEFTSIKMNVTDTNSDAASKLMDLQVGGTSKFTVDKSGNITVGGGGVPSGTKQLFVQTAAPTGWTKDTTHDNKALRIVSGTAGSGGSDAFTTTFGSGKTTAAHTLTTSEMPAHTHSYNTGVLVGRSSGGVGTSSNPVANNTSSVGGGGSHSHNLSGFDLQYVDVIIATKD